MQEEAFLKKYQIRTVSINHETPKIKDWWRVGLFCCYSNRKPTPLQENVHNGQKNASQIGTAQHLIITAEQLFKSNSGHYSRMAFLICEYPFCQRITHVNVDEAHFIHYAGMERFGIVPFRPCWGRLLEFKMRLPPSVQYHAFTATCPLHVQKTIEDSLLGPDYSLLKLCINRPGIVYARHCVKGSFANMENYCCFLKPLLPTSTSQDQPQTLVFFENSTLARNIAKFLNQNTAPQFRGTNFARHYYSMMLPTYLEIMHSEFTKEDGSCRILCATSGESTVCCCMAAIYIELT